MPNVSCGPAKDGDQMNPLRAALFCFFLAALVLFAQVACPDTLILVGAGITRGMGEQTAPAPLGSIVAASHDLRVEGTFYGSSKLESGAGWGIHGTVEGVFHGFGAGLGYSHRNGGEWAKDTIWLRGSYSGGPVMILAEGAITGYNRERKLEMRLTGKLGRFVVQPRWFVEFHLQGTGYGFGLMVGVNP